MHIKAELVPVANQGVVRDTLHSTNDQPVIAGQAQKDQLRFITCGSVDDGKSTLIGRLLHDCKLILDDQLTALSNDSETHGTTGKDIDFALLVDGLEAERQQGITIDVAYRYFSTHRRSFIVADTPGHEQYTRNMATGASTADLAILLVDARKGLLVQTRRHALICSLLGIRHVVLAVNKIDLVSYSKDTFERIVGDFATFAAQLGFQSIVPVPISARHGDNMLTLSGNTPWYSGATLLEHLETIDVTPAAIGTELRFPVQWVNRPNLDFRGYAGTIMSGAVKVGDEIVVAASGRTSRVKEIVTFDGSLPSAHGGDAVTVTLEDEIDIMRGDMLVTPDARPEVSDQFAANLLWMGTDPLIPGRSYLIRTSTCSLPVSVTAIKYKIDVNTREHIAESTMSLNDIAVCNLATSSPIAFDPYATNRKTGCFIIIDRMTNATVGAGMILFGLRRGVNVHWQPLLIERTERQALKQQKAAIVWFTGLSGAGKSTIANLVEQQLHATGHHTMMLDGDNLRHGINKDLGFTEADRAENIRRVGEIAKLMTDAGLIVLCSFVSPYQADRDSVRALVADGEFIEVFVDAPIEECMSRDTKGLYAKAKAGKLKNFTGIDAPYEVPSAPELRLDTKMQEPSELAGLVLATLAARSICRA